MGNFNDWIIKIGELIKKISPINFLHKAQEKITYPKVK